MESGSDLIAVRRQKLDALRAAGVAPFGGKFGVDGQIQDVVAAFGEGKAVRAAGRITAHRDMGKSQFLDLSDFSGRIQTFFIPGRSAMRHSPFSSNWTSATGSESRANASLRKPASRRSG